MNRLEICAKRNPRDGLAQKKRASREPFKARNVDADSKAANPIGDVV